MSKEENLKYIKSFTKITLSGVCRELGIDRDNVKNGKASAEKIEAVRNKIEEKIKEL